MNCALSPIKMLTDGNLSEAVNELAAKDKGLVKKLKEFFSNWLSKIKGEYSKLTPDSLEAKLVSKMGDTVNELQKLFIDALATAGENYSVINGKVNNSDVKFSNAGEHSLTANTSMLQEAKRLEKMGVVSEEIRQKTGWFKSYDKKWRYEIDDSKMKLLDKAISSVGTKLSKLIEHNELFEAYPQLKSLMVKTLDTSDYRGMADFDDNTILISQRLLTDTKALKLRDEVFNSKEYREYSKKLSELYSNKKKATKPYLDKMFDCTANGDTEGAYKAREEFKKVGKTYENKIDALNSEWENSEKGRLAAELAEQSSRYGMELNEEAKMTLIHEIQHFIQYYESFANGSSTTYFERTGYSKNESRDMYNRTAGEIEARDVANRVDMTSEQRKNTRPNIDRADVVFADSANGSYSIDYTDKNIPVVVVNDDILNGIAKSKWVDTVKKTITNKFSNGIPISGRLVKVNKITKNEFTNSKYTNYLKSTDGTIYTDKFKTADNLDEIILASVDYVNEDLKHKRNDSIKEFVRGNVLIRVGNNDYSAKVIIGFTSGGNMLLYDVIDFNKTSFNIKNKTPRTAMQNAGSHRNGMSSTDSISNPTEKVNNNFKKSARNSEYLELAKDPEKNKAKLQEMVNEAAKEAMPNTKVLDEDGNLLVVYHGTNNEFYTFDKGNKTGWLGKGIYFSSEKSYAKENGKNVINAYINATNPYISKEIDHIAVYSELKKKYDGIDMYNMSDILKKHGYDAIIYEDWDKGMIINVFNSSQIKSADPVTYDDNGNVIPLEERFNENKEDIRYSSRNQYSKALTSDEWKKYNNAMTSGVDAGLRINDHSMLVECEKGDYSYKLVIYDNTFEENPIKAVYGIGNDDYSSTTIHDVAGIITDMEDKGYGKKYASQILRSTSKMYKIILGNYNGRGFRIFGKSSNSNSSGTNTQNQSNGTGVSGTNS